MAVKLVKHTLSNKYFSFDAIIMLPSKADHSSIKKDWGLFTHGYTASKNDCLSWAQRLAEAGAPAIFFDLPGHYLGSFKEVESFEEFKDHSHECFITAFESLKSTLEEQGYTSQCERVIFGGHSLGALLTLKAIELEYFEEYEKIAIGVGLGVSQHKEVHLFETDFYQKTLDVRRQLVSPAIDSDLVFPWIKEEKLRLKTKNKRVHLITGLDDVVVGPGGMETLEFNLKENGNNVTTAQPRKLPHHDPTLAASHINSFLKKELLW